MTDENVKTKPPSVTLKQVLAWRPCYKREKLEALAAGRERITALEILDLDVSAKDRLWTVLHKSLIPEPDLWELACRFAEQALNREHAAGREPDPRSWGAIKARRKWLRGEISDEELAAAYAAADAAACASADAAAYAAAYAAADASADASACAAAYAAAYAAADASACASAYAAASHDQIALVRKYLLQGVNS